MYSVGAVPGKFFPPHRGHLKSIIEAACQCKKLYVVVSDDMDIAAKKCEMDSLPLMPLELRAKWMSIELQNIPHIEVLTLDETGMLPYPEGSAVWTAALRKLIPDLEVIFGGEKEYQETYMKHLGNIKYILYDYERSRYPVSATKVRQDYLDHWDYILGSARYFFARRVLLTGTESCGKTTMTKYLAKIFHTSWSEEYGRHYSRDYLGGNENVFTLEDFFKVAFMQQMQDEDALKSANRIVFFDSDAVVTQYYCQLYLGQFNPELERFVDPAKYDAVFLLSPNVKWVPDGLRWKSGQLEREELHEKLKEMYLARGFENLIEINADSYSSRLDEAVRLSDTLLVSRYFMSRYRKSSYV